MRRPFTPKLRLTEGHGTTSGEHSRRTGSFIPVNSSPEAQPDALVVGAGAAGLAAAYFLQRAGLSALVIDEAESPGESWRMRYDDLRLNSVRTMSSLPGSLMPRRFGTWPAAAAYAQYLEAYRAEHGIAFAGSTQATRVDADEEGFVVDTSSGQIHAPNIVVATGHDRVPWMPDWEGREQYSGRLLHAADYRNAAPFAGQDVLVVGAGNSGCDIAAQLATGGARSVQLSVRTGPLLLDRHYLGVPLTYWSRLGSHLPDISLDAVGRFAQRMAFGDLTRYDMPEPGADHTLAAQRRSAYIPTVDGGFVAALKRQQVRVLAAVERMTTDGARHVDGSQSSTGTTIAATGYTTGLQPLVGHLGALDDKAAPKDLQPVPGLFFVGYRFDLSGGLPYFKTEARRVARIVASTRTRRD